MKRHLFCALCALTAWTGRAQEEETNAYLRNAGTGAVVYSGKEEAVYPRVSGHPYLDTERYREGTLCFDGRLYPRQQMRLDVCADELVLLTPDSLSGIVVPPERMDSAVFPSFTLFYNVPDGEQAQTQRCLPDRGYHARLHNGIHPVWKRQTKIIERVTSGMNIEQVFTPRTRFYIRKDGRYQSVSGKRSLLKLFAPKKKELNLYIRRQQLSFKEAPDSAIVRLVTYYESLTSQ
jgi:hypothetical protein